MTEPTDVSINKRRRFGETTKFVPIIFVAFVISTLWIIFTVCHLLPMLQFDCTPALRDHNLRKQGWVQLLVFNFLSTMLLLCYVRSVLAHPGEVPDNDAQWEYIPTDGPEVHDPSLNLQESKKSGQRRFCKWCSKYKPDRCHHCRICKTCILKMDHHCPWIYNCVGFKNYKYFFLLLIYSMLTLHYIVWNMGFITVQRLVVIADAPFLVMFLVLFGETMAFFFAVLVTTFLGFHIWLISKAMSTIEFCEKSLPKHNIADKDTPPTKTYDASVYDLGVIGNFRAILGPSLFLMLVPVANQGGDGLTFVSEETRLCHDIDTSKGIRVKGHRNTQRRASRTLSRTAIWKGSPRGGYGHADVDP